MKSKCCNYEVTVNYGEEGTNCWICGKCWKPCDICPQEPKPLACEKHSRILIGKNKCVNCHKPKPKEGWEERLTYLGFTDRIDIAEWTGLVNFISSLLSQTRKDTIEEIREIFEADGSPYKYGFIKFLLQLKK